jgi:hypothetical protein
MFKKLFLAIVAPAALLSLSACMTGFPAQVQRFNAMPAPEGQSFVIQAANEEDQGGLEFAQYADHVRRNLIALGYREASGPRDATLLVTLDYGVDGGRERIVSTPGVGYGGFGRPYFSRFGYFGRGRHPFFFGWHDPLFDHYEVRSYTVYTAFLDLDIRRTADNQSVFEGGAQARARTNELPLLVPNLIEAMFTGFPGNSGERVRITVAPERSQER